MAFAFILLNTNFVANSDVFTLNRRIPNYLQANLTFARAKQYFQENLPYGNLIQPTNANIEFAVLCGITGKLVQASIINHKQDNTQVSIQAYASYARQNYDEVARTTHELLFDATQKIRPITDFVKTLCSINLFFDCNEKVDARVYGNPFIYHMPAKLHIHLGKLSRNIMRNQILIEKLINNNEVVEFFSLHVKDNSVDRIIKKLARTYTILKMMSDNTFKDQSINQNLLGKI